MADSNEWYINEDGFLSVNDPSETIHYHPTLNAILVVTKEPAVKVIDVNSGSLLQKSNLSASHGSQIQGCYINKYDQMLFTDGHAIGLRKEYCGMLLLDTILQVPVNIVDEIVKIELPFAEALKLLKCLFSVHLPGVDAAEDFIKELDKKVFACQPSTKKNHKLAKWCTICLELPYCVVRTVCTSLVQELKRVNRLVPALAIASAINERLTSLLYNSNDERDLTANGAVDRNLMYSEATRKETFAKWPHMSYKWALPDQMAQAGFYHQPNSTGDDRALCFTCNVCLVCWEPTDEPWSEHERHSPSCPFVKGEYTQNVPLSVSYATSPAVLPGERMEQIHCLSSSSFPGLIATATRSGHIIIWNVRQQLKKELQFFIDPTDSLLLSKRLDHARYDDTHLKSSKQAWIEQVCEAKSVNIEEVSASSTPTADSSDSVLIDDVSVEELLLTLRPSRDVKIHKLCVLGSGNVCTSTSQPRPVLAVGLSIRQCDFGLTAVNSFSYGTSNIVQALNDANQSSSRDSPLDIMKVDKECPISNLFSRHQFHPFILIYDIDTQQNNGGNDAKPSCGSCDSVGNSLADTSSTSKSQPCTSGTVKEKTKEDLIPDSFYDICVKPSLDQINDFVIEMKQSLQEDVKLDNPSTSSNFTVLNPHVVSHTAPTWNENNSNNQYQPQPQSNENVDSTSPTLSSSNFKSKTPVKSSESLLRQCVELPEYVNSEHFYVGEMLKSCDGSYLIVSVNRHDTQVDDENCSSTKATIEEENDVGASCAEIIDAAVDDVCGALFVYRVIFNTDAIYLEEMPIVARKLVSLNDNVTSILVLPTEATVSPTDDDPSTKDELGPNGYVTVTTYQGKLIMYRLSDMHPVAEFSPKKDEKFVSVIYLNSIDRICACTQLGTLYFLQLCQAGISSEDFSILQASDIDGIIKGSKKLSMSSERGREPSECGKDDQLDVADVNTDAFLINQPFTSENVNYLYELTQFENLTPQFSVTVPPCWTEIQQEQKQRRHPQHLQQQGEAMQHTRSWRLQSDHTTWDEHLFEISLSRPCCIGHLDLKFNLHPSLSSNPPKIELTLLKQISGGMSRQANYSKTSNDCEHVDSPINFNMKPCSSSSSSSSSSSGSTVVESSSVSADHSFDDKTLGEGGCKSNDEDGDNNNDNTYDAIPTNPVFNDDYLQDHNAEILCGPVDLGSCLDLSGQSGIVTLTSPSLLKTKCRTFLLHIKALINEKEQTIKTETGSKTTTLSKPTQKKVLKVKSKVGGNVPSLQAMLDQYCTPGSAVERLANSAANKKLKGCDWFHEISITIRKTGKCCVNQERLQRCAILETPSFHLRLLMAVCGQDHPSDQNAAFSEIQHTALDVLIWICAIQMNAVSTVFKESILTTVQSQMTPLINACFIHADRTVARKCSKLIVLCMEYSKQIKDPDVAPAYSYTLLQSLVECLPQISQCRSSGALRWFFLMLNRVKCLDVTRVGHKALNLLLSISKQMQQRSNPYNSLLRARFGLYGTPFDYELFEFDAPVPLKSSSTVLTYASVVSGASTGGLSNNNSANVNSSGNSNANTLDDVDFRDLLNLLGDKNNLGRLSWIQQNQQMIGLMEVEPLHYVCHAASDGTKMEKMECSSASNHVTNSLLPVSANSWIDNVPSLSSVADDFSNNWKMLNQLPKVSNDSSPVLSSLVSSIQQKQEQLMKLKKQKQKIEQKMSDDVNSCNLPIIVSLPSTSSSGHGFQPPPTPKTTPLFMTPPLTPPGEHNYIGGANEVEAVGPPVIKLLKQPSSTKEMKNDNYPKSADFTVLSSPWHHLLHPPVQQMLVIERMHSGARRFVVLDFGHPILLTDLMIPCCSELVSLSVDVWVQSEESDGCRLVVSTDIGFRSLVMNDLHPPAYCQYLKITIIGRYGMNTTRCRIPIGYFFGHTFILPWEKEKYAISSKPNSDKSSASQDSSKASLVTAEVTMLNTLQEDIHCRYSLACNKLQTILQPYMYQESASSSHTHYHLQSVRNKDRSTSLEDQKVFTVYEECIQLQQQLNLVCQAVVRLQLVTDRNNVPNLDLSNSTNISLNNLCLDKLRVIADCLLDMLLGLTCSTASMPQLPRSLTSMFDQQACAVLFNNLCMNTTCPTQLNASSLLVRICTVQPWWGNFLASTFRSLYASNNINIFPQDRIFILLTYLGQKSLSSVGSCLVMESFLKLLSSVLEPLCSVEGHRTILRGILDLPFLGWLLLFLSSCLDTTDNYGVASNIDDNDLSNSKGRNGQTNRWKFIQGEASMQKSQLATNKMSASSRSYRRKLQKRLMHHKQRLEDLEFAKKAFLASTKAMSPLNNQISGSLEAAVKQQEEAFTKTLKQQQSKHFKDIIQIRRSERGIISKPSPQKSDQASTSQPAVATDTDVGEKVNCLASYNVCVPVARRLVTLLLHMDFTSSTDLFLLACKVLAKIVTSARPVITLGDLMTVQQLQQLFIIAVKDSQNFTSSNWGHQWVSHAITCLLLDVLEGEMKQQREVFDTSSISVPDEERFSSNFNLLLETIEQQEQEEELNESSENVTSSPGTSGFKSGASNHDVTGYFKELPMLIDSDESSDEYNTDNGNPMDISSSSIPEKLLYQTSFANSSMQKKSTSWSGLYNAFKNSNRRATKDIKLPDVTSGFNGGLSSQCLSTAMDCRLEQGIETMAELRLKIMLSMELDTLHNAVHSSLPTPPDFNFEAQSSSEPTVEYSALDNTSSVNMLSSSFDSMFVNLRSGHLNLESVLTLWLSLSSDDNNVPLSRTATSAILSALTSNQTTSLRVWCLFFQSMTLNCNRGAISSHSISSDQDLCIQMLVNDSKFLSVLFNFLSGSSFEKGPKVSINNVGPMVMQSFQDFFTKLQLRCDVSAQGSRLSLKFKKVLLNLVKLLVNPGGPIRNGQGPLDAQIKVIDTVLHLNLNCVDAPMAVDIAESVTSMVHNYIMNGDRVNCCSHTESWVNASSCFGGLFAGVLRNGLAKNQDTPAASWQNGSRDTLLCLLLQLSSKTLSLPLDGHREVNSDAGLTDSSKIEHQSATSSVIVDGMSQTDEHKTAAASSMSSAPVVCSHSSLNGESKVPSVADEVLRNQATINDLLSSLANCCGSSMAILLGSSSGSVSGVSPDMDKFVFREPVSVGDGIFHLLCSLNANASKVEVILGPVYTWLSTTVAMTHFQPSPLILSEPLLWFLLRMLDCSTALNYFNDLGGVELIAANLVRCHSSLINSHPSLVSMVMQHLSKRSSAMPIAPSVSSSRNQAEFETSSDGLNNFAPLGTITSSNPTAQPADSLIHSVPPHPRARTPAWSYHFYPEENWIDLTITLPCAILLHEIQIQPHLTSLATCPSAVSVDISRGNTSNMLIPVCPPQPTSGLTFIRLLLSRPEIASAICLRLHKPRDSSNMGLSQILLIGSTTFSESVVKHLSNSFPSEEVVARSSLGWLRLLHHYLTSTPHTSNSRYIAAASSVPGLLESCCSLLQTPALWVYMSHIEKVLLTIGRHDTQLGLDLINILLNHCSWTSHHNYSPNLMTANSISATDSIMEIIYSLCTSNRQNNTQRIQALLEWLSDSLSESISSDDVGETGLLSTNNDIRTSLSPAYIHCIAAVLWQCGNVDTFDAFLNLLDTNLVRCLCEWSLNVRNEILCRALDSVLCSICYLKPDFFQLVLRCIGLTQRNDNSSSSSLTDHQKNLEASEILSSETDDYKEANNFCLQDFYRCRHKSKILKSLAIICQSPPIVKQLLDSGFMTMLTQVILDYCSVETCKRRDGADGPSLHRRMTDSKKAGISEAGVRKKVDRELVVSVLEFFTKVSSDSTMRDWLGSSDGNSWWLPLLSVLCDPCSSTVYPASVFRLLYNDDEMYETGGTVSQLENSVIEFLSTCCWCHPANQQLIAEVLCQVICKERNIRQDNTMLGISGFTRRLILQLLLENEKILVYVQSSPSVPLHKPPVTMVGDGGLGYLHPQFSCGHNVRTVYVSTQTTCSNIVSNLSDSSTFSSVPLTNQTAKQNDKTDDKKSEDKKEIAELGIEMISHLSLAAGVSAKDKRHKDNVNMQKINLRPPTRRGTNANNSNLELSSLTVASRHNALALYHDLLPGQPLPDQLTLAQLLTLLEEQGLSLSTPYLVLSMRKKNDGNELIDDENVHESINRRADDVIPDNVLTGYASLPTMLQVFASMGGLSLLAQHLPLLYPEISRQVTPKSMTAEKTNENKLNSTFDCDWVKVEAPDDMFDEFPEFIPPGSSSLTGPRTNSLPALSIPPYSLAAFGLFLRLPGYADVLLREKQKAQCLLRLALGVTDDADGSDIFSSNIDPMLPTLPFCILRHLFDATPLTTDDGVLLRRMSLDVGVVHLILACLSVLSHHNSEITLVGFQHEAVLAASKGNLKSKGHGTSRSDDKGHLYWAKGTGFGTGSTAQSWDVEQHIIRQRSEEEHVTCLLLVLASYANPGGLVPSNLLKTGRSNDERYADNHASVIPSVFHQLLAQSCLLPAMSSYLRNDSVLDMARHVPLYRSLLKLLRALASSTQLVTLLLPQDNDSINSAISICNLLSQMKTCVDTYANRLKTNKLKVNGGSKGKGKRSSSHKEDDDESEGLALLIPDIQETARIVMNATKPLLEVEDGERKGSDGVDSVASVVRVSTKSVEDRYLEIMKALQFDTYEMITEDDNGIRFTISHHFESNMRAGGDHGHPSRARRLAQETVTLSTSLPLSYSSSVFVRCDQDRLDIMKVLITGPSDTPYVNGCFEFDVYFPPDYPNSPMLINLETTGHHTVRFNPNLYNDGKVCLSILNTWHGRPEEKWNSNTSSFLQVLVSIQSLILVPEPYFNEPGYERSRGTISGNQSSREYDANIRQATVKWAILEQLRNPCPCFKDIIQRHLWMKRGEILRQCEEWIADMETTNTERRSGKTISLNRQALKRHTTQLKEEFAKLKPPAGLEGWTEEMTIVKKHPPPPVTTAKESKQEAVQRNEQVTCMNGDLSPEEEANFKLLDESKVQSLELCDFLFDLTDGAGAPITGSSPTQVADQFLSLSEQQHANSCIADVESGEDKESMC